VISATTENDIEAAFPSFVQQHIGVLIVGSDPFIFQQNAQLVTLAALPHSHCLSSGRKHPSRRPDAKRRESGHSCYRIGKSWGCPSGL